MKEWHCKKHNTFGDEGWSCAYCGYPLGIKVLELKNGKVLRLTKIINLFLFTVFVQKEL